jgi:hypothetical protein
VLGRSGKNDASLDLVTRALPDLADARNSRTPARAADRLAYDLHERLNPAVTVALDINPLLSFATQRIARGARIHLHEISAGAASARRRCDSPRARRTGAGASRIPLHTRGRPASAVRSPKRFDAVVTPWFVDIVDEDLPILAQRINRCCGRTGAG